MRVFVYPADLGAGGHYRGIWPAEHLASMGHDVVWHHPDAEVHKTLPMKIKPDLSFAKLTSMPDCDVVVIQRPIKWFWPMLIRQMQDSGIKVVGDLDDDYRNVHPHNIHFTAVQPKSSPAENWQHLMRSLALCDRITVTTDALMDRYGHGNQWLLPNYVPASMVVEGKEHTARGEDVVVGWAGDTGTHPKDLCATEGAVGDLQRSLRFTFMLVGQQVTRVKSDLKLSYMPEVHPWCPLAEYPEALSALDIGIVPLEVSRFNEAKSHLKGLEYMARGIPFIASDLPEYRMLSTIASTKQEWMVRLRALVSSPGLRADCAQSGLERVQEMTIEHNINQWAEAWLNWSQPGLLG